MWRSSGEQVRQLAQVNAISLLELELSHLVLLDMMVTAEADRPAIRWLQRDTPIGVAADVSTLNRAAEAARNAALMSAHPGAVSRALAAAWLAGLLALKPVRELGS